jgi:DNA-binding transcriptional LysR family regulator
MIKVKPSGNRAGPKWAGRHHPGQHDEAARHFQRAGHLAQPDQADEDSRRGHQVVSLVAAGAGVALVPRLAAGAIPPGVRLLAPAEPVTRQIFTLSRRGGDRKAAVRVVLDALAEAAQTSHPVTDAA